MKTETKYNGWKNRETWNVSLWINNDEVLYRCAVEFMRNYEGRTPYLDFIANNDLENEKTPDGAAYSGRKLGLRELNSMMRELIA